MSLSTFEQQPGAKDSPAKGRGVLCAKCEHLNPVGIDSCETCGAHLFVSCGHCGARNERVRTRCVSCGRRIHRTLATRIRSRFFGPRNRANRLQVFLFMAGIAIGVVVIFFMSQLYIPKLW